MKKLSMVLVCTLIFVVTAFAAPRYMTVTGGGVEQKKAERQVRDIWVSPQEHYFGAASCHPHCGENQGDNDFFQEHYSDSDHIDVDKVGYMCRGNGHTGDPCAFDSMTYSIDPVHKILNVTWRNRSDEVWVRLTAPIKR